MAATHNPPEDFVAWLNGQTVNSRALVAGTNLFACPPTSTGPGVPTFPARCVFVWSNPGLAPLPYLSATTKSVWSPGLQVRVRGDPGVRQEARQTCRDLMRVFHKANRTAASPPYVSVLVGESEPIEIGIEETGQFEYGFNVRLVFGGE